MGASYGTHEPGGDAAGIVDAAVVLCDWKSVNRSDTEGNETHLRGQPPGYPSAVRKTQTGDFQRTTKKGLPRIKPKASSASRALLLD
eukprot:scaffold293_cov248-Pinguiococcus_pyrenoidosus.AAC.8